MGVQKYEYYKDDWVTIYCGDSKEIVPLIKRQSIDLIVTDPPYPEEFLPLFSHLSLFGKQVLKLGRYLLCYSGQFYLPEVMNRLCENLTYKWTISLLHVWNTIAWPGRVINRWKPIIVMQNGKVVDERIKMFKDVVNSSGRDKRFHDWGQSVGGSAEIIKQFSKQNDIVLDPFLGGGTTCAVSKMLGRRSIGIEIDEEACKVSTERVYGVFKSHNPKYKMGSMIIEKRGLLY